MPLCILHTHIVCIMMGMKHEYCIERKYGSTQSWKMLATSYIAIQILKARTSALAMHSMGNLAVSAMACVYKKKKTRPLIHQHLNMVTWCFIVDYSWLTSSKWCILQRSIQLHMEQNLNHWVPNQWVTIAPSCTIHVDVLKMLLTHLDPGKNPGFIDPDEGQL